MRTWGCKEGGKGEGGEGRGEGLENSFSDVVSLSFNVGFSREFGPFTIVNLDGGL
jgi:hypothetical protein